MKATRVILLAALALVLVAAGAAFLWVRAHRPQLELGVGYAARVACGCRYIEGRPIGDCHKDFEPGMEPIRIADDPATKTITASVPLLAKRRVRFDSLLGCVPEPFTGAPLSVPH
jgi:hypothetical protein